MKNCIRVGILLFMAVCLPNFIYAQELIQLPDQQGEISVHCQAQPRAMTSEGYKRYLQVKKPDGKNMFLKFPETASGEDTRINVYWYSGDNLIRLKDTLAKYYILNAFHECLLDMNDLSLGYIVRDPNATVYLGDITQASESVPQKSGWNSLFSAEKFFPDIMAATASPYNPVIEGKPAGITDKMWTKSEGQYLGYLECEYER